MKWTGEKKNYQYFHQEKIDKYEYLTGENILPLDESRIIRHSNFTYFVLWNLL